MKYDIIAFEKAWTKYSYKDSEGYKCQRGKVLEEYEDITGVKMPSGTMDHYLRRIDREKLYNEKHTKTFNERTDDIIDEPHMLYTEEDLLVAMGIDPVEFETTTNTANRWWLDNGDILERIRNGQIKINFRKRQFKLDETSATRILRNIDVEPVVIEKQNIASQGLLKFAFNDMHFGNSTLEDYKGHRSEAITWIETKRWDEIIIKQGGDMFHTNNSEGTTVAGTKVGHEMDLLKMVQDAHDFMSPIIESAIENSNKVKYVYIEGNHDKDVARLFAYFLSERYPQVEFDLEAEPFKYHLYHDVFLGFMHGDKPRNTNKVAKMFFTKFRKKIALAETVEIHLEHVHHEKVVDDMGFVLRTNPTANKEDKYHKDNGFIGSRKIFQAFIYNDRKNKAVINIDGE